MADALMVEKFEYIENPEGFLRSKIAFNQKKELKFLLDARVQKLIRNLLEEIKNELTQKEEKKQKQKENLKKEKQKEEQPKEEPFYLEYEPDAYEINQVELNLGGINAVWEALNKDQKEDFYNNYLKRHPYLELFIRKHFPTLEAFDEEIKSFREKVEKFEKEEISIEPWTPVQLARLMNLLSAYIDEHNIPWF